MTLVRWKLWLAFTALGTVWGSTWVASTSLAEQLPTLLGEAVRCALAALLLTPVILLRRPKLPRGRSLWVVLILSASMLVLPSLLLLGARQSVASATVTVLFAAMPLFLTFLTERKAVSSNATQAAIVAIGAILLTTGASFSLSQAPGILVVLIVVASIGASSVIFRRELRTLDPLVAAALVLGPAAPLLLIASLLLERGQPMEWNGGAIGALAVLAIASAAAYPTYFWLLQQLEAYQVATVQWLQPLVALAETAIALRLRLSFSMIAGTLVALVCLWVVMRARPEDDNTVSLMGN